jgi:hypothetical protein
MNLINETDKALFKRLKYINDVECRPASYKDFENLEVNGKLCKLGYGTLRNKISVLKKKGDIERYYNSKASFFVIKGVKFGKQRTQHEMTEQCKIQLSELIHQLPESNKGLHDIHTSFQVQDIWTVVSY